MAKQTILIGSSANDKTGDPLRTAFTKANTNFTELYALSLPIGYAAGNGGTVTQSTSRTTGVTLNKLCGTITLFTTTLAANTSTSFTLTNSTVAANDMLIVNHATGGTLGLYNIAVSSAAGSAVITIRNVSESASASETPVLQFLVLKAAVT